MRRFGVERSRAEWEVSHINLPASDSYTTDLAVSHCYLPTSSSYRFMYLMLCSDMVMISAN